MSYRDTVPGGVGHIRTVVDAFDDEPLRETLDATPPRSRRGAVGGAALQGAGFQGWDADPWPLSGRDRELRAIESCFQVRGSSGVVLAGRPGVGKTRLAREALATLTIAGAPTVWATATRAAASIPFGAMAHLIPKSRLDDGPLAVLDGVCEQVDRLAGPGRLVIAVDDAHLLDDGSAAVLAHLAAQSMAFLLMTTRIGEPAPDAVVNVWKDGMAQCLIVPPLPVDVIDRLVDHVLGGGHVDGLTRQRLHALAAGNPLVLGELLHSGLETTTLRQRHGVWHWRDDVGSSGRLGELVTGPLLTLDADARRVFELVALGEPLPLRLVERLAVPAAIEAAENSGLIAVEHSGTGVELRTACPMSAAAIREAMPLSRARAILRRLGDAALAMPIRCGADVLRVALWQAGCDVSSRPDILIAGAREAVNRSDLPRAELLARAARNAAPGQESACLLAEILAHRGRFNEAAGILPPQAPESGNLRTHWAVTRSATLYWGNGELQRAEQTLGLADGEPGRDLTWAAGSRILLADGQYAKALALARRVLAETSSSDRAVVLAAAVGTAASGALGRYAEALALSDMGMSVAATCRDDVSSDTDLVGYGTCFAHLCAGKLGVARDLASEGYGSAVGAGTPLIAGGWAALRGFVAAAQGRVAEAHDSLREAVVALERCDGFGLLRCCTAGVGLAAALSGNSVEARSWLTWSDQLATPANRLFAPWIELWRAWVHAADGATTKAIETARHAVSVARTAKAPTVEALALYDVARLGGKTDLRRLRTLAESLDIPLTPALVTAATGQATSDGRQSGELLAEAAGRFESLGHYLLAMEARLAAARAYRKDGKRRNANMQAERAVALREKCAGARTPMSICDDTIAVLTRREREVVLQASDHSSKEIAEHLGLSVRTVDNYLVKSYAKLQISGRADLRALLRGTSACDVADK